MKIENLYKLPNLKEINLSNNYIKKVENLPDTLNTLFLSRNQISVLENIPVIVNFLSVDENPLRRVIIDLENSSTKATTIEKFWIND
jgi:Leucine-rich repeat (LRR) protein